MCTYTQSSWVRDPCTCLTSSYVSQAWTRLDMLGQPNLTKCCLLQRVEILAVVIKSGHSEILRWSRWMCRRSAGNQSEVISITTLYSLLVCVFNLISLEKSISRLKQWPLCPCPDQKWSLANFEMEQIAMQTPGGDHSQVKFGTTVPSLSLMSNVNSLINIREGWLTSNVSQTKCITKLSQQTYLMSALIRTLLRWSYSFLVR